MLLRSTLALLLLLGLALLGASCSGETAAPTPSSTFALGDATVTIPARAAPNGPVTVSLTAKNLGDGAIAPGDVTLVSQNEPPWKSASLALQAAVEAGATATFTGTMTAPPLTGLFSLAWQPTHAGKAFGPMISARIELSCDDAVFCNGAERFAGGKCVAGPPPCDDGQDCTTDSCDEKAGRCQHQLGPGCAACFSDCKPDCTSKLCGDDGCGGSCGKCAATEGCAAALGVCKDASQPGTCQSPIPLIGAGELLIGQHTVSGDSSNALNQVVPTCNSTSTAVETIYSFTTTDKVGLDARSHGYDTVLHLRKEGHCLDDSPAGTIACSDDASPPGDYGSHLAVALDPGTYYLIVDGFDSTQFGPFTLSAHFVADGCVPQCDGRYCGGDDGCGGDCGTCPTGNACVNGRCRPDPCTPDCDKKKCGDDGCGGTCGDCPSGQFCVAASWTCQSFPVCDHAAPTCAPACAESEFCGTDCACHPAGGALPDLVIDQDRLEKEILFDQIDVSPDSCALVEACVGGPGQRSLLRFSVEAVNQGQATLAVPPPDQRPDLFQFSPCHGHYHFNGFAAYALLDTQGQRILTGHKQAYCMEDTEQVEKGPKVACSKAFDCSNQGIQAGWSDLYGNTLDCQWLDITGVPSGDYFIQVTLNPNHVFEEVSFDNNVATVPVHIP